MTSSFNNFKKELEALLNKYKPTITENNFKLYIEYKDSKKGNPIVIDLLSNLVKNKEKVVHIFVN